MAFSFFFVLDSQLVLRLAVLSHEPEGQVIYTSNGEISGHSWSNFFTLTPCSKSLTHHNHRQGHPDCERGGSKGRNHQVRQRLKSICSHLKLSDTLWQPSCFGWNPGLQSLKNHTCIKVSFQGQQAQNSQLYWSTTKSPKCLHGTNSVPKTSSDSAIHPHVQHLGFLRALGLEIPGQAKLLKMTPIRQHVEMTFQTCSSQGSKASSGDWRMFVIFCKFQMDLWGFSPRAIRHECLWQLNEAVRVRPASAMRLEEFE